MDFRRYLIEQLEQKKKRNKSFSLRAFALLLDEDPSYLSKVMRGKKDLSLKKISSYSEKLNLSKDETSRFLLEYIDNEKNKKIK